MKDNKEVYRLKSRLKYYDKTSFLCELDKWTHAHPDGSYEKNSLMPSYCYLLLEWLLEAKSVSSQKIAKKKDIDWFMDRLWQLNEMVGSTRNTESVTLYLRPIVNNQFWLQQSKKYWLRSLLINYSLMSPDESKPFNEEFYQVTKVSLSSYFKVAAIILHVMDTKQRTVIFSSLVKLLFPHFEIETIARSIRLVAMFPYEVQKFLADALPRANSLEILNADTRLLHCPVILTEQGLYSLDNSLLRRGICESPLNHFLRLNRNGFRQRYGRAYESFIVEKLAKNLSLETESDINKIYKVNGTQGKVVDGLVRGDSAVVFVEAKGVMPRVEVLTTSDPTMIKRYLKDTVTKAAKQIIECAFTLEEKCSIGLPNSSERFGLIVTQGEHYLKRFSDFAKYVAPETMNKLEDSFGCPVPYNNIFVCNINDFERLMSHEDGQKDYLTTFMQHCRDEDSTSHLSKMLMQQHVDSFIKKTSEGGLAIEPISSQSRAFVEDVASITKSNLQFWECNTKDDLLVRAYQLKSLITQTEPDCLKLQKNNKLN